MCFHSLVGVVKLLWVMMIYSKPILFNRNPIVYMEKYMLEKCEDSVILGR